MPDPRFDPRDPLGEFHPTTTHNPTDGRAFLRVYRGLPGSGKTTDARNWVAADPDHRARVNRDDIRAMLRTGPWSRPLEDAVTVIQHAAITALLTIGRSVAVDDTNLSDDHFTELTDLALIHGAILIVEDYRNIPIDTCILRDAERQQPVGADVIVQLAARHLTDPRWADR